MYTYIVHVFFCQQLSLTGQTSILEKNVQTRIFYLVKFSICACVCVCVCVFVYSCRRQWIKMRRVSRVKTYIYLCRGITMCRVSARMGHVSHTNASCLRYEGVMSHVGIHGRRHVYAQYIDAYLRHGITACHVSRVNASGLTYGWVMCHRSTSHVARWQMPRNLLNTLSSTLMCAIYIHISYVYNTNSHVYCVPACKYNIYSYIIYVQYKSIHVLCTKNRVTDAKECSQHPLQTYTWVMSHKSTNHITHWQTLEERGVAD